jgi:branched-chain amino acid transport system permease protein
MMELSTLIIYVLNGFTYGMILFLIASGLNLVFGVLGVLNFAHGSFYMLGAYLAYYLTISLNSFWLALLFAPVIVGLLGAIVEYTCVKRVYSRGHAYQILITFGFVLIFQDLVGIVWGTDLKSVPKPQLLEGFIHILDKTFPLYNFFVIALGPLVTFGFWLALTRTKIGKIIRAAAGDPVMTNAIGVNVPLLYTIVFAIGTWLGGLSGTLTAPLQATYPGMALTIIIEAFIVIVIGGLGSFQGAALGALIIGQMESFGIILIPKFAMAFIYILTAAVLLILPRGLASVLYRK